LQPKRSEQPTFFELAMQQRGSRNPVLDTIIGNTTPPTPSAARSKAVDLPAALAWMSNLWKASSCRR
jgi:hypothetical protein